MTRVYVSPDHRLLNRLLLAIHWVHYGPRLSLGEFKKTSKCQMDFTQILPRSDKE